MLAIKPTLRQMGLSISLFALLSGLAWGGDITVYDKAPSVEELQRQLVGDDKAKRKFRTRAIIRDDELAPAAQPEASPADAPAPQAAQVGDKAVAFPINFRINSSEVLPESVPFIESIAGLMQQDPGIRILIEGHTDKSGSLARNTALSRERAFAVMNYLVDHYRIDPTRLVPVGKGPSEPLSGLEPGNPKNRRVQFRIIG